MLGRKVRFGELEGGRGWDLLSVRASLSGTSGTLLPSRSYAVSVHTRNVESQYNRGFSFTDDSSAGVKASKIAVHPELLVHSQHLHPIIK